jgi:hypothetical protein
VEKIEISADPGTYRLVVSHKGSLVDAPQAYSMVWDGLTPIQPPVSTSGSRFEALPGILPLPTPDFSYSSGGERGMFFTALEDMTIVDVGIRLTIPCPSTFFVAVYKADDVTVLPGQLVSGQSTMFDPGSVSHYISLNAPLEECQDYYISFQIPDIISGPAYDENGLSLPFDAAGAIRVRAGATEMDASANGLPVISFIADVKTAGGDTSSNLEPVNMQWSTCSDQSTERGLYIRAKKTMRLQSMSLDAAFSNGGTLVARVYESSGLTRGELMATGQASAGPSQQVLFNEVPINALLVEGKEYDIVMEFPPTTWSCASETGLVPFTVDDAITVLTGEAGGNASNTFMPHLSLRWREGAGGTPIDLSKDQQGPPFTLTTHVNNYGLFVEPVIDQEVFSVGWKADVPAGAAITVRIFDSVDQVRGALLSEGSILSSDSGYRWHEVPIAATVLEDSEYDIEVEMEDVNEFGYWDDATGLPYVADGLMTVLDGECNGNPDASKLPEIRVSVCGSVQVGIAPSASPASVLRAYPNPARGIATIDYFLDKPGIVSIDVHDVRGRLVTSLLDGVARPAGPGGVKLNGKRLGAGVYFVKLKTGSNTVSRRITIVR